MSLEIFTQQYMVTALWSSSDETDDQGGEPLDKNYTVEDIAPETRTVMEADCKAFYEAHSGMWESDDSQAGHDYWLSRNGHGAGFFDRDYSAADTLQELAKQCGEVNLYVGDDDQIHA